VSLGVFCDEKCIKRDSWLRLLAETPCWAYSNAALMLWVT
jgi:hypothetical protein